MTIPRNILRFLALAFIIVLAGCESSSTKSHSLARQSSMSAWERQNPTWRGIHFMVGNQEQARALKEQLPVFARMGINAIVAEVNYGFEFQSHPELRGGRGLTADAARDLSATARANGIRLIPQFNCLGHQSWARTTFPLLVKYPQFDETPDQYLGNTNIYCRSWCPQHPEVNKVVFALIDELIDAFQADAFHVGMDEVFLIASKFCPRCKGGDPARLFAKAVNDLHAHIVGVRKVEMLMWGDRLLDSSQLGYSEWEAARNGTQGAVDLIPRDIIICDWHYNKQAAYPSVPLLLDKGFRVWPAPWQPLDAVQAFSGYARKENNPRMLGMLWTTWGKVKIDNAGTWPPIVEVLPDWVKR